MDFGLISPVIAKPLAIKTLRAVTSEARRIGLFEEGLFIDGVSQARFGAAPACCAAGKACIEWRS
jgi:hypothetical protein